MSEKVFGEVAVEKYTRLVKGELDTKVDKVEGKVLSDNNYTNEEKQKLANMTAVTKVSDLTNDSGFQTSSDVQNAINHALSSVYTPKGSLAFSQLPVPSADNVGHVYNVTNSFTTSAAFVEGAGVKYGAGTNVVVVSTGQNSYAWDVLGSSGEFEEMTAQDVQTIWDSV